MKAAYIMACCLLTLAVVLDVSSKRNYSTAARCRAKCLMVQQAQQANVKLQSQTALVLGNRLALGGMVAAGMGVAFWGTSAIRQTKEGKRKTTAIPLALLIAYGLLLFMAV